MKRFVNFSYHKSYIALSIVFIVFTANAYTLDSLKERLLAPYDFLPDYYLRFDISTFAFHQNKLQERNFLAEPHPELEFCFLSYKDLIASVWGVDFLFGLGEVPGNNVFTVLNVEFGIEPAIELKLKKILIDAGIAHRCFHEIDRKDYPVGYFNRLFIDCESKNYRLNSYWQTLHSDSLFTYKNRIAWSGEFSYYLKEFFGLVYPGKLNGANANIWDGSLRFRYAFYKRRSWTFALNSEAKFGIFDPKEGFQPGGSFNWYGSYVTGMTAFFSRGTRGACFYTDYHLDHLPVPLEQPDFAEGNSRFSKNGMLQIGIVFFN